MGLRDGARSIHLPFLTAGPVAVLARAAVRVSFVVIALVPVALLYDVAVLVDVLPTGPRGPRPAIVGIVLGVLVLAGTFPRADDAHVRALFPVGVLALAASVLAGQEPRSVVIVAFVA